MVFNFNLSPSLSTEKLPVILIFYVELCAHLNQKHTSALCHNRVVKRKLYSFYEPQKGIHFEILSTCWSLLTSHWRENLEFTTTENTRRVRNGWLEKIVIYAFREVEHCCWLCGNTLLCNVNTYHTSNTPNSVTDSFLQGSISVK